MYYLFILAIGAERLIHSMAGLADSGRRGAQHRDAVVVCRGARDGAAPRAFGMADGHRLHHRERPGAQRPDPGREPRAGLRMTPRGIAAQPSSALALAFDSGSQVSPNAIAP